MYITLLWMLGIVLWASYLLVKTVTARNEASRSQGEDRRAHLVLAATDTWHTWRVLLIPPLCEHLLAVPDFVAHIERQVINDADDSSDSD